MQICSKLIPIILFGHDTTISYSDKPTQKLNKTIPSEIDKLYNRLVVNKRSLNTSKTKFLFKIFEGKNHHAMFF